MTNKRTLKKSITQICEAMFTEWYGRDKINRFELETSYDQAREDILFWNEEKENETTKELK